MKTEPKIEEMQIFINSQQFVYFSQQIGKKLSNVRYDINVFIIANIVS